MSTETQELRKALRRTAIAGVVGIFAVVFALTLFVLESRSERDKICDVVTEVTLGSANALVGASAPEADATEEELERRQRAIDSYYMMIHETLEGCS